MQNQNDGNPGWRHADLYTMVLGVSREQYLNQAQGVLAQPVGAAMSPQARSRSDRALAA